MTVIDQSGNPTRQPVDGDPATPDLDKLADLISYVSHVWLNVPSLHLIISSSRHLVISQSSNPRTYQPLLAFINGVTSTVHNLYLSSDLSSLSSLSDLFNPTYPYLSYPIDLTYHYLPDQSVRPPISSCPLIHSYTHSFIPFPLPPVKWSVHLSFHYPSS